MNDPVVFATSRLIEADMAAALLEERGLPFYRSMESGGVRRGMQVAVADFPGVQWLIHVPAEKAEEAERLLSSVPRDLTPPRRRGPGRVLLFAAVILILMPLLSWATCH